MQTWNNDMDCNNKVIEFQSAMERYTRSFVYQNFGILVSSTIILLQVITLFELICHFYPANFLNLMLSFVAAYILTDFVNGLVHMYMDNNTDYVSVVGPFVASFHLHHKTPQYKNKNPLRIYFDESGTKFWLVVYLCILFICELILTIPTAWHLFFVAFGILSSLAELSHYWCHNSRKNQHIISLLQKCYILLPKKHHAKHHLNDNINYAFLNGVTDPIINIIAKYLYTGYKENADKHVLAYQGLQTTNR